MVLITAPAQVWAGWRPFCSRSWRQGAGSDINTPGLEDAARAGMLRYVGGSDPSRWQMMKTLAGADRLGFMRPVSHQVHFPAGARLPDIVDVLQAVSRLN